MKNYNTNIVGINLNIFPYKNTRLQQLDESKFNIEPSIVGKADLSKIIGCYHPDYSGKTIGELKPVTKKRDELGKYNILKRAHVCQIDLESTPEYFLCSCFKVDWDLYKYGENIFIRNGMHRSILGLYFLWLNNLATVVQGVAVSEITLK